MTIRAAIDSRDFNRDRITGRAGRVTGRDGREKRDVGRIVAGRDVGITPPGKRSATADVHSRGRGGAKQPARPAATVGWERDVIGCDEIRT